MFDFEGFVEDCKRAVKGTDARDEIQELVERAVSSRKICWPQLASQPRPA